MTTFTFNEFLVYAQREFAAIDPVLLVDSDVTLKDTLNMWCNKKGVCVIRMRNFTKGDLVMIKTSKSLKFVPGIVTIVHRGDGEDKVAVVGTDFVANHTPWWQIRQATFAETATYGAEFAVIENIFHGKPQEAKQSNDPTVAKSSDPATMELGQVLDEIELLDKRRAMLTVRVQTLTN